MPPLYLTNSRHHDLPTTLYSTHTFAACTSALQAQPFPVIDQEAIAKSGENLAANLTKAYQHGRILHFTEAIDESYTAIVSLQQQVLEDMKQAESMADLHWSDLSKSVYLATELVKGAVQPGIEVEYVIEHPLFQRHPSDTYRQLFVADGSGQLPADLTSLRQSQTKRTIAVRRLPSASRRTERLTPSSRLSVSIRRSVTQSHRR